MEFVTSIYGVDLDLSNTFDRRIYLAITKLHRQVDINAFINLYFKKHEIFI